MRRVIKRMLEELERTGAMVVDGITAKRLGRALKEYGIRDRVIIGWDRYHKRSAVVFLDEEV